MKRISLQDVLKVVALGAVYYLSARLGLMLDAVGGVATPVWPPTGISLAAVLLLGYRAWPGIALGAFFANLSVGQSWGLSLSIACGNTAEALVGAFLLRAMGFRAPLRRLRDVLLLLIFGALFSTICSATVGAGSARLAGRLSQTSLASAWWTWWSGDLLSDLILAPVVLTWSRPPTRQEVVRKGPEFFLLLVAATLACQMAFGVWSTWGRTPYPLVYLIFPFALWAALRFDPRATSLLVLWVAAMAVWHTTRGVGPFRFATLHESLVALQFFLITLALTSLVLSSLFMERRWMEARTRRHISDLQRLSRLKSEFASIVAHELKTPLTVVKEGISLVVDGVDGEVNERQAETLNLAVENVDRLGRLIRNVLNYEKLEAGRWELKIDSVDLKALTREVSGFMELAARKKNIRILLEAPEAGVVSSVDADKVREVLINLIDNAMKNTSPGGKVFLRLKALSKKILLEVEDTGRGIAKEEQEHIFQIFRQGTTPDRVHIPGAGIGLAVCKLIVELHQGKISVESEPGVGAKFKVELPRGPQKDFPNRIPEIG